MVFGCRDWKRSQRERKKERQEKGIGVDMERSKECGFDYLVGWLNANSDTHHNSHTL